MYIHTTDGRSHLKKQITRKMDIATSTSAVLICAIFLGIWAWRFLNWVWFKPKKLEKYLRHQGLNGNSYKLFFGDLKEGYMMSKEAKSKPMNFSHDIAPRVSPLLHKTVTKYGKVAFTWFGPRPAVFINDAEMVKEIFSKPYIFVKPENYHLINLLIKGLAAANKDTWSRHRKIINPAFHHEKIKIMVPIFYSCCCDMVSKWDKIISEKGLYELDLWPNLEILTSDALSRAAFGSNYEEGKTIFDLQMELGELVMKSFPLPGASLLPTKNNRRVKEIAREMRSSIQDIITKRLKTKEDAKAGINYDDLLGVLLESNLRHIKEGENKNLGMSMEEIIEECEFFHFAGHESTSVLIMWALILLSKHLDWQERARDEILQVLGGQKPDFDDLSRLKVVNMILLETLRLYPPGIMFARVLGETTKLGSITLPSGVQVNIPTLIIHRDQEIWGNDANEFNPERFSDGVSSATKGKFGYFPFGYGPRVCMGQNFAMLEAKVALATFLQHFAFDISPSYAHAPYLVVTLQAQHGAQVIVRKVENSE